MRELILVDDASRSKETRDVLADLARADDRVVVLRLEHNQGPGPARNRALAAARCDWIGFLDADDTWMPSRAAGFARALAAAPGAGWFAGTRFHLLPQGQCLVASPVAELERFAEPIAPGIWRAGGPPLTRWMIANTQLFLGQTVIRRELLGTTPFPKRKMIGTDWLLFMRLAARAEFILTDEPWFVRRDLVPSITHSSLAVREGNTTMLMLAMRQQELAPYQRELNWTLYAAYKCLAVSNLLLGERRRAFAAAGRALALDPREIAEFAGFCRAALFAAPEQRRRRLAAYFDGAPIQLLGDWPSVLKPASARSAPAGSSAHAGCGPR